MGNSKKIQRNILPTYPYIDSLRGFAIFAVMCFHGISFGIQHYPGWVNTIVYEGARGVQLFYIVSAVTLCLSLAKRRTTEEHAVINFYIRRFFRIAPLFYLAMIFYLWQENYWLSNPLHISLMNIISTVMFNNGVSPQWINNIVPGGWSIAIEITFYLLLPLIVKVLNSFPKALIVTFISMILCQVLRLYLLGLPSISHDPSLVQYTFLFFPSQFPVFLIGLVTYFLLTKKEHNSIDKLFLKGTLLLVGLCIALDLLFGWKIIAGHYIYGIVFGGILLFLSTRPLKLFVNSATELLGKISYGLYLTHAAVLGLMDQLHILNLFPNIPLLNYSLRMVLLFLLSGVISYILYRTIEVKGIQLGKYVIKKFNKKVVKTKIPEVAI